jgi:hypothetical protein
MKDAKFTLEFVTHCLANGKKDGERLDTFPRDSHGKLIWKYSWWYAAFSRAINEAGLRDIKPNQINVCLTVEVGVQIHRRRIKDKWYREHEAIFPGTKVSFDATVDDAITEAALRTLLERVGHYIGISPWGHNLGFGRFEVVDVEVGPGVAHSTPSA